MKKIIYFLTFLIITSCSSDYVTDKDQTIQPFYVSKEYAASLLRNVLPANSNARISSDPNVKVFTDENGEDVIRIFEIAPKGFIVMSADKRVDPVLGFSFEADFFKEDEAYPTNFRSWIEVTKQYISYTKTQESSLKSEMWTEKEIQRSLTVKLSSKKSKLSGEYDPEDPLPCDENGYYTISVGPLMSTSWGQGDGYNELLAYDSCNTTLNGRVLTGCNATAMAQVMKYHQKPSTGFSWSLMPNSGGSYYTSELMKDAGDAISTTYGCLASSAYPSSIAGVLSSNYGYYYATYDYYDYSTVISNIASSRPVILAAWDGNDEGHTWVTDGYLENLPCEPPGLIYKYLHMNWGWNGSGNMFVNAVTFSHPSSPYVYNRRMVYNIF